MRNVNFLFGLLIVTLLTCTITSHVGAISTDNENAFLPSPTAVEIVYAAFTPTSFLYFPHVSTVASWGSEITVINYSSKTVMGTMRGYDSIGNEVNYLRFDLPAHGRREINVANTFGSSSGISYAVFESDSDTVLGYTKFFVEGKYRAALPAVSQPNSGDFYIPHIASNSAWWTGVGLVNTTSSSKLLTFTFNNGATRTVSLAPKEHQSFTISSLFGGQTPSDINSATVTGGDGVVGLGLFGSKEGSGMNYLSGVLLKGSTATNIYFPHVASDATWCTGIVAYNPSSDPCTITVLPYTQNGVVLETRTIDLPGKSKYIGTAVDLNLPSGTAWFEVEAINPITGFELFGTKNGNQLAGYTGVGISATEGIFPKIEDSGWTGIAFVNIDDSPAFITLTAHDDNGDIVAVKSLTLGGHSKIVGLAENLFSGSISGATYIRYSSDMNVVGFQLNGSNDNMMLDALPGISVETADGLVIDDEGGSLSLLDEQGNRIEIIFPRGALDTPTNISVELLPEQLGLPIGTRHASAFIVKPYNVELYQPVTIRISYNKAIEDIRRTALYRNRGEILAPLADHKFGVDSKSIEARAFRLGEFVEGKMSMEQIIDQVTLIFDSYGISWGSSISFASTASTSFRRIWNKIAEDALAEVEYLRNLSYLGIVGDPEEACKIVEKGVEQLLDMNEPDNVCDRDYSSTMTRASDLIQRLDCHNYTRNLIESRVVEIGENCHCLTPDNFLLELYAQGSVGSITLYGNGTFDAVTPYYGGKISGKWSYFFSRNSHIMFILDPSNFLLSNAVLFYQLDDDNDMLCNGDRVLFYTTEEDEPEVYPLEIFSLMAS